MTINDNPLVSIIIITYMSSKFVLEALESAKVQNYDNIELIVSDDCSTDDTINFCYNWIEKNKKRFIRTKLVTYEKNTGVGANCNRGLRAAQGEWAKFLAGDDLLEPTCISDNVDFIRNNKDAKFIFSNMISFYSINGENVNFHGIKSNNQFFAANNRSQHKNLVLNGNFVLAPTSFCNIKSLYRYGLFDEKIPIIEDYPMWLKITKAGEKLLLLDKTTVLYRKHDESINSSINKLNTYSLNMWMVYKKYRMKDAFNFNVFKGWHLLLTFWINCYREKINYRKYFILLSPLFYFHKIRRNKV